TRTDAIGVTGATTVMLALPATVPLVPMMSALPAPMADTTPVADTVATLVFDEVHATDPPTTAPLESRRMADACALGGMVSEEESRATGARATCPAATIVNACCPTTLSTFARTMSLPGPFVVMVPASIRASEVSLTDHVMVFPNSTLPREFFTTALAWI